MSSSSSSSTTTTTSRKRPERLTKEGEEVKRKPIETERKYAKEVAEEKERESNQLEFEGAAEMRWKLVLATVSGKPIKLTKIRTSGSGKQVGIANYEVNLLRLLEKITNGTEVEIDATGTELIYRPGVLTGGRHLKHTCAKTRGMGYFIEPLIVLGLFCKDPISIELAGVTNNNMDVSVDA